MEYLAALNAFCLQVNEFCLLFQREILRQPDFPLSGASAERAQLFAQTLILCPTPEAARTSIRRDLTGARSFLIACAVEEILDADRQEVLTQAKSLYAGKVPALPS